MVNKATDNRPPFFMIEDSVIENYDLNPFEGWLYVVITKHANRKTGESFPSVKTLAKETKMSKASVLRYTKSLEAKGLIRVERDENTPGKDRESNHYWLLTATAPVSDSNRGSFSQTPPPVSESNTNQSQLEPEIKITVPKSKKDRDPDPMFDAIAKVWGNDAGGWVGSMKSMLTGTAKRGEWARCKFDPPVTSAQEILDFEIYMLKRMKDKNLSEKPTACVTIQRWFYDFRNERNNPRNVLSVLDGLRIVS